MKKAYESKIRCLFLGDTLKEELRRRKCNGYVNFISACKRLHWIRLNKISTLISLKNGLSNRLIVYYPRNDTQMDIKRAITTCNANSRIIFNIYVVKREGNIILFIGNFVDQNTLISVPNATASARNIICLYFRKTLNRVQFR